MLAKGDDILGMSETKRIKLTASSRKEKTSVTRKEGLIPAVVYGPKTKPISVAIDAQALDKTYKDAGKSHLIDLDIDGENKKVLIYDLQFDPVKDNIIHVDFYAVRMDQEIHTEIPIRLIGESFAIKDLGGTLLAEKDSLEIECLPQDLIDDIELNIAVLDNFEKTIKVSDIKLPETIKVLDDPEQIIALIQPPRSEEELAELEEAVEEDVEAVEVEEKGIIEEDEEGDEAGEAPAKAGAEKPTTPAAPTSK
jgi:large subunit ribosomal protein L25